MIFNEISQISKYLINSVKVDTYSLFGNYYVKWLPSTHNNHKFIRIEKIENGLFGTTINATYRSIGSIDIRCDTDNNLADITFWLVNDKNFVKFMNNEIYGKPLDDNDSNEIKKLLFDYAEKVAKENNCNILRRDVHNNMREYNESINNLGFKLTGKRSEDNPFWLITYKNI